MQIIRTLDELDAKLRECDRAEQLSDDHLREVFATFCMEPPKRLPVDPFSPVYREFQLDLYRTIAGKDYSVANEATIFEVDSNQKRPFPYSTGSSATAGDHLMALGFLLRCMALPPRSRVLELGFGWGNSTLAFAALGHEVTAVDIEPRFCELVRRRAAHEGLGVNIVNADFLWIEDANDTFDAVIFFESFHHSDDHFRLLHALRHVVTPQGRLFFAAEPIQPDFAYPWGLRLDGQSLWSIRKHGWLELGFSDRYFAEALARSGWFGSRQVAGVPSWLNVWEARLRQNTVFRYRADHPGLQTQVGERIEDCIVLRDAPTGAALFGPYVPLPAECYLARICFRSEGLRRGRAVMDVCAEAGKRRLAQRPVEPTLQGEAIAFMELPFAADQDLTDVEVRLFCDKGFSAEIEAVEIRPAPWPATSVGWGEPPTSC
jgi:SAM-dependent methyltransferase